MVKVKLEPTDKKEIRIIIVNINKTQVLSCVVILLSQLLALINCYFLIVFFVFVFFQWKNLHSCEDNQREWRIIRGVFRTLLPWTIFAKHKILDVFDRVLNTPPMMVSVRQRLFSRFRTFSFLTIFSANTTKWSNTFNQYIGCCQRIVRVCLTILWGWRLKG